MPHCILEYSSNVSGLPDMAGLLHEIHDCLMATGLFKLEDIKSRAVRQEEFRVGEGSTEKAFVSLQIAILEGRSDEAKAALSRSALDLLRKAFSHSLASQKLSLSVEIRDLHRASYVRFRSGLD